MRAFFCLFIDRTYRDVLVHFLSGRGKRMDKGDTCVLAVFLKKETVGEIRVKLEIVTLFG